jgi:hypothetical protein
VSNVPKAAENTSVARALRRLWYVNLAVSALSAPLLKIAGFATSHRIVPTQAGTSSDPFTQGLNACGIVGALAFGSLLAAFSIVGPLGLPTRNFMRGPSRLFDFLFTFLGLDLAYEAITSGRGLWWRMPVALLCLCLIAQKWVPWFVKRCPRTGPDDTVATIVAVESLLTIVLIPPAIGVGDIAKNMLAYRPIAEFTSFRWECTLAGLLVYGSSVYHLYRYVLKENPFRMKQTE